MHTRRLESRAYFNSRAADGAAGPAPVNAAPMTALRRSCDMTRAVGSVNSRASFAAFETLESLTLSAFASRFTTQNFEGQLPAARAGLCQWDHDGGLPLPVAMTSTGVECASLRPGGAPGQ